MSPCSGRSHISPGIEVGNLAWPLSGSARASSSPAVERLLGVAIENSEGFKALLDPEESSECGQALSRGSCFRIELALPNACQITMTATVDGSPLVGLVQGTLGDIADGPADVSDGMTREELWRAVAENSPTPLWIGDENGKCVCLDPAQHDFRGVDPELLLR